MLVTDARDKICRWQVWDVSAKSRHQHQISTIDLNLIHSMNWIKKDVFVNWYIKHFCICQSTGLACWSIVLRDVAIEMIQKNLDSTLWIRDPRTLRCDSVRDFDMDPGTVQAKFFNLETSQRKNPAPIAPSGAWNPALNSAEEAFSVSEPKMNNCRPRNIIESKCDHVTHFKSDFRSSLI